MIITVSEIQKSLNRIWPDLEQIWCFDQEYIYPTIEEVAQFVTEKGRPEIKAENPDCDDFALQLHAKVKRFANWSFGEVFANKVQGMSKLHNLNICCCQDGVFLIEPRKRTVRTVNAINDNILWVRI